MAAELFRCGREGRRRRSRGRAAVLVATLLGLTGVQAVAAPPAGADQASADLSVAVTHSPGAPKTGTPLTITLTAANAGPSTATAVVAGFTFGYPFRYTPPPGASAAGCRVGGDTSTAICSLGDVAPGASKRVSITVTAYSSGVFVVPAAVSSETPDPDMADRSASDTIIVQQGPTQIENAVGAIYRTVLGRAGSPAEIAHWSQVWMQANYQAQNRAPYGIISGAESRARRVREIYQRLLHRPAGKGEVASWSARMAKGTTWEDLEASVASSREFVARTPSGGSVDAVFQALLGRRATASEVASWNARLRGGAVLGQLTRGLVRTTEARDRVMTARYRATIHRAPVDAERFFWFSALDEGSTSDREWAKLFISSEFLGQFPPVYGGPIYPVDAIGSVPVPTTVVVAD